MSSTEPPGSDSLAEWLAPSTASQIDQIPLADVHDGWTPERTGELPMDAAVALIRAVGVIEPVTLRRRPEGGYLAVTGHRTIAAARAAQAERIPAVVRHLDDAQALAALALDGSATGTVTAAGRDELHRRLLAAGVDGGVAEELIAAVAVAAEAPAVEEQPIAAGAGLAPEPAEAVREREPAEAVRVPEPAEAVREPEPALVGSERAPMPTVAGGEPAPAPLGEGARWVPLPAGAPRMASLSSAFVDAPRLLRRLAEEGFTGTFELAGDGRADVIALREGRLIARSVEVEGRRVDLPARLPSPDSGAVVTMIVRPHAAPVVTALALAISAAPRLRGLHAAFLDFSGLLGVLARDGSDAAVVVSAPAGAGVVLLDHGRPLAAYARRAGELPGEAAETTDLDAVAELLTGGEGEVDVHSGRLPSPQDLDSLLLAATG